MNKTTADVRIASVFFVLIPPSWIYRQLREALFMPGTVDIAEEILHRGIV